MEAPSVGRAATAVRAVAPEAAAVAVAQEVAATQSQHRQSRRRPEPIPSRALLWLALFTDFPALGVRLMRAPLPCLAGGGASFLPHTRRAELFHTALTSPCQWRCLPYAFLSSLSVFSDR